ncbi:MAG: hypothetical protein U5L45_26630 [Saprospiraceae bacterium]|nr:hypothetical protein [Saprospiraceae bacterium]
MWFVFRRSRKTNHVSSLLRERSARKTSVFNQKTMFLGYAHSSVTGSFSLRSKIALSVFLWGARVLKEKSKIFLSKHARPDRFFSSEKEPLIFPCKVYFLFYIRPKFVLKYKKHNEKAVSS